ncbi:MAG: DNA translocase FtsK [Lachnospiraceae bacterium]|nr:DNA translocase FtsK [Lachnospiraceae bacterium]
MAPQVSKEQTSKEQIKDKTEQAVTHIAWKPQTRSIEPQYTEGVPDHMAVSNPMIDRMSTQEELLNEVPTIENPVEKAVEGSAEEPVSFKPSDNLQEISLSALEERQKVEEEVKTFAAQPGEIYRPMSDPDEPLGSYLAYDTIRDVSGSDSFEIENEPAVAAVEPVSENIPALIKAVDDHFAASGIVDEGAVDLGEDVKTGEEPSVEQTGTADMASVVELPEPEMAPESDMFWGDIPEIMPEVERETLLTQEPTSEEAGIQGVSPFEQEVEKETTTIEEVTTERPVAMQEAVVVADTATEKMMPKDSIAVEEAETEESLIIEQPPIPEYHLPPIDLLSVPSQKSGTSEQELRETSEKLHQTLANFGVNVTITDAVCGPTVTRYELQPEKGVKVSKIVNLADDIKLNLAAADIRIEAPIPGKPAIGIEVPNREATVVSFRELMESPDFEKAKSPITFAAGRDIGGKIMISDIAKMPHVLIAGATGSGKSVCINTIIMSILYKAMPDEVKFIMIDPKVVELSVYNGIPHLLIPVVTDPKKAAGALQWAVKEMMDRYDKFAKTGVRDMKGYNAKILNGQICYEMHGKTMEVAAEKMPQIVVIVDELADLMMVASHEVEESICRLAQLARAAGIHLVIATQRPSVNVITGLIKANMPSRIAFAVTSGVDSRTILDMVGAEKLLGKGDMLYYPQGLPKPLRVQGAFVSDKEVAKVVDFIRNQVGPVEYDANIDSEMSSIEETSQSASSAPQERQDDRDAYFDEAVRILTGRKKASISMLQRYLKVGFNRAARIIDQLEEAGIVGPDEGTMGRKVLITPQEKEEPGEKAPEAEEEANE